MRPSRTSLAFFPTLAAATVAAIGSVHCGGGSFSASTDAGSHDATEDNPPIGIDVIVLIDSGSEPDSGS
jgi:hypothetical protein